MTPGLHMYLHTHARAHTYTDISVYSTHMHTLAHMHIAAHIHACACVRAHTDTMHTRVLTTHKGTTFWCLVSGWRCSVICTKQLWGTLINSPTQSTYGKEKSPWPHGCKGSQSVTGWPCCFGPCRDLSTAGCKRVRKWLGSHNPL